MTKIDAWLKSHEGQRMHFDIFPDSNCHYRITFENGDKYEAEIVDDSIDWHTRIVINGEIWQH